MIKLLLLTALAQAGESAHHASGDPHAIPWGAIFVQTFNFALLIALGYFFLNKVIRAHFASRAQEYNQLVERAAAAKREAETAHHDIKTRLEKLESGAEEGLRRAQSEAAALKSKLMQEASNLSQKLETEAKRSVQIELEKAKSELRNDLLESALQASSVTLKTSLSSNEQKRLQNEFVEKIQVGGG